MGKMRATQHNARGGKDGAFSARHNDRDFNISTADHIDPNRQDQNWYWHCYQSAHPELTFEDAEKRFYDQYFTAGLTAKNERYIKQRHKERCQTMDEYRRSMKTCPEETIMAIGSLKDGTVRPEVLHDICMKQLVWEQKTFPQVRLLNVSLHADEEGVPHIQSRKAWIAYDKDGNEIINQNKALELMGIERPDPGKKKSRYNNPKMTYTAMCRNHLLELCRERGLDIEVIPREASKSGRSMIQYQADQEKEKAEQIVNQAKLEAEQIVQDAKTEAVGLIAGAKARAQEQAAQVRAVMQSWEKRLQAQEESLREEKADIGLIRSKLSRLVEMMTPAIRNARAAFTNMLQTDKYGVRPNGHEKLPYEATVFGLISRVLRFKKADKEIYPLFDTDHFLKSENAVCKDSDGKWQAIKNDYIPKPEDWLPSPLEESIKMIDQVLKREDRQVDRSIPDRSR